MLKPLKIILFPRFHKYRRLIGMLHPLFYRHSSLSTLYKLCSSLIRPHLEYCSSVWDPSSPAVISKLKHIQHFALKLSAKSWSSNHPSLLQLFNCLRLFLFLLVARNLNSLLFSQILNGYMFFPTRSFRLLHVPAMPTCTFHPKNLLVPRARTSAFLFSFVPHSSSLWNSLPPHLKVCSSIGPFKYNLNSFQQQ